MHIEDAISIIRRQVDDIGLSAIERIERELDYLHTELDDIEEELEYVIQGNSD